MNESGKRKFKIGSDLFHAGATRPQTLKPPTPREGGCMSDIQTRKLAHKRKKRRLTDKGKLKTS